MDGNSINFTTSTEDESGMRNFGEADTFADNPRGSEVKFSVKENGSPINTAIILMNFQNEFVDWAGKLHSDVGDLVEKTGMLDKVPHVIRAAR